ncbi:hypothetical protein SMC2_09020 [Candidatus Cryosericum hinesii]|uniref:Uncharacterized protein n=1 Tax=Candidatus Cryosericum hinesii TaxID=2290915 RepID=A0ABX9MCX6_9BACT|nr:hypothetical protein SMC2_09020 [Candidatus Cryosericum hinesii]
MALTLQEKQHVGREVALRYLRARKKEKRIMLREFCATQGTELPMQPTCSARMNASGSAEPESIGH